MPSGASAPSGAQRRGILCAGSVVVDLNKVIDTYPARERLAVVESVSVGTGGPALNLAMDLARLGAGYPLAVVGVVGDDAHGRHVVDALDAAGIDARGIAVTPSAATSFTDAMVERDGGARTFFHHIGANALFTPAHVRLAESSARILHLGAPGLHPGMDGDHGAGWVELLAAARAAGMRTNLELVSLAPERIRDVAAGCLRHLDSIVVNEVEACALAGQDVPAAGDWDALAGAAVRLVELGVHRIAVIHRPEGCVAAERTDDGVRTWRQPSVALPRELLRGATGAGDAFASGVVHGLHEGWPVPRMLEAGVCVAAACLQHASTSDGVQPLAQCLELGRRHGFRSL